MIVQINNKSPHFLMKHGRDASDLTNLYRESGERPWRLVRAENGGDRDIRADA